MSMFQKLRTLAGSEPLRIHAWQKEIDAARGPRDEAEKALADTRSQIQATENWLQEARDAAERYLKGLPGARRLDGDEQLTALKNRVSKLADSLDEMHQEERTRLAAFEKADRALQKLDSNRPLATAEDVEAAEKRLEMIQAQEARVLSKLEETANISASEAREAYSEASALRALGEIDAGELDSKRQALEQAEEITKAAPGLEQLRDDLREQESELLDIIRELRSEIAASTVAEQVERLQKMLNTQRVRKLVDEIGEHDPGFRLEIKATSHQVSPEPIHMQPASGEGDEA